MLPDPPDPPDSGLRAIHQWTNDHFSFGTVAIFHWETLVKTKKPYRNIFETRKKNSYSPLYWLLNRDPQKWFIIIPTSLGVNPLPNSNSNLWSCDRRSATWPWLCSLPHQGYPSGKPLVGISQGLQDACLDHRTFLCEPLTVKLSRSQDVLFMSENKEYKLLGLASACQEAFLLRCHLLMCLTKSWSARSKGGGSAAALT